MSLGVGAHKPANHTRGNDEDSILGGALLEKEYKVGTDCARPLKPGLS